LVIKNFAGILLPFLERSADKEDIDTLAGSESERAGLCAPSYSAIKERIPGVRLAGVAIPKDAYKKSICHQVISFCRLSCTDAEL
jgi:hypothetical protein